MDDVAALLRRLEPILALLEGPAGPRLRLWTSGAGGASVVHGSPATWAPRLESSGVADTPDGPRWFAPVGDDGSLWLEADSVGPRPSVRAQAIAEVIEYVARSEREVLRLSQELASRYEEIDLLYTISEILGQTLELERAAQTIVRAVASVVGARRGSILLLDEAGTTLRTIAAQGLPPGRSGILRVDDPHSVAARVIREHRPLIGDPSDAVIRTPGVETRGYQGHAFMSVPICYSAPGGKHRCIGVVNLTDRIGGDRFTPSDRKLVTAIANQVGSALENARLVEREKEQDRINRELELARRLQHDLLPRPQALQGLAEVGVRCLSLESVGGDFYGLSRLGRGAVGIMVGDVSSHGFAAALLMASVVASVGIHSSSLSSPAEILLALGESLGAKLHSTESHVTVFYGALDPARGELVYASAGHAHAFRIPAVGDPIRLDATAPPLGLDPGTVIESRQVPWVKGSDLLCIWTDGLADASDPSGRRFGERRILEAIADHRREHPEAIVAQVMAQADAFAPIPNDDRTLLVLRV